MNIKEIVEKYDLWPKKSFGQNFLFDLNITQKIVKHANVTKSDHVLEIGPGPGALTYAINQASPKSITVIEKDDRCIKAIHDNFPNIKIINQDALKINLSELEKDNLTIIANLPYNISTKLLLNWIYQRHNVNSMTLMFQKEVADRILSQKDSKSYGRLSVICQTYCDIEHHFDLKPEVFFPKPKIISSVITLKPKKQSEVDIKKLENVTRTLFANRRKKIKKALESLGFDLDKLALKGILPDFRAENISIEQFAYLCSQLTTLEKH